MPDISAALRPSMPDISAALRPSMPDISAALRPSMDMLRQSNLISQSALKGIDREIMGSFHDSMALQRAELYKSISGINFGNLSLATARRMAEQESDGAFVEEDAQAAVEFAENAAPGWSKRIRSLTGDVKDRAVELLPAAAGFVLWILLTFISLVILGVLTDVEALMVLQVTFANILYNGLSQNLTRALKVGSEAIKEKDKDPNDTE